MRILVFLCLFSLCGFAFAGQPPISQTQRAEELMNQERSLRQRLEADEGKYFIKTITVQGANLLSEDEISAIVSPYQKKWLGDKDIQQIIRAIKQAYKDKGRKEIDFKISSQIKKKNLLISVTELSH